MSNFKLSFSVGLVLFGMAVKGYAVPAAPIEHELTQPDGTHFMARQWGDERRHGWETPDGYAVIRDAASGVWYYAVVGAQGRLVSSGVAVNAGTAPENAHHARPARGAHSHSAQKKTTAERHPLKVSPKGTANIAVVLVNFKDTKSTNTPAQFNTLLFGAGNSMKAFYKQASYGKFSVAAGPSGVRGWYKSSKPHDYYGANDAEGNDLWTGDLVYEAVAAADAANFNFAAYDQDGDCYVDVVAIVHQGQGEEGGGSENDIWSHRSSLSDAQQSGSSHYGVYTTKSACPAGGKMKVNDYIIQPERYENNMMTMGVFAHEYGHSLGLPDLYDPDNSSEGIGEWSLMAAGSWTYVKTPGDRPALLDAWSKYFLGWVKPVQVKGSLKNRPIKAAHNAADVYQLGAGSPSTGGEYFLVENRQRAGFDAGLPGDGLLIWHIDEAMGEANDNSDNANECYPDEPGSCVDQHYRVGLVQADGLWHLEHSENRGDAGDAYPGENDNREFSEDSDPSSMLYNEDSSGAAVSAISDSGMVMKATLQYTP